MEGALSPVSAWWKRHLSMPASTANQAVSTLCHFSDSPSQCPRKAAGWGTLAHLSLPSFPFPSMSEGLSSTLVVLGMETRPIHILRESPSQALQQCPCRLPIPLKAALHIQLGSFLRMPGRADPGVQSFPSHSEQAKGQAGACGIQKTEAGGSGIQGHPFKN